MRQWLFAGALALASFVSSQAVVAAVVPKTTFPRVGGINMGNPYNYSDPTYTNQLAKLDLMILKTYPGRASWNPTIQAIKAKNPDAIVVFYLNVNERDMRPATGSGWNSYISKMSSMKWWLYANKTTGSPVESWFSPAYDVINMTPFTKRDSAGLNGIEWMTKFYVDNYYKKNTASDGFFIDNVLVQPNVDGDWNLDGKIDKKTDVNAGKYWRQGYAAYFRKVRTLMPGKVQIGNIGGLGDAAAVYPEYAGLIDGGVIEGMIGKGWSIETYKGWAAMMAKYRKVMKATIGPKLVIFNQWGNPTDYQAARYGLASTLMDNGYHNFTNTAKGYTGVVWFDEYNANLGVAESAPPTAAWKSGVYRRDFDKGIALVNPKGNGAKTITLESDFYRLKGSQAPTVNSGAKVRTITLKDRDGIILMRSSSSGAATIRPEAPMEITIQ